MLSKKCFISPKPQVCFMINPQLSARKRKIKFAMQKSPTQITTSAVLCEFFLLQKLGGFYGVVSRCKKCRWIARLDTRRQYNSFLLSFLVGPFSLPLRMSCGQNQEKIYTEITSTYPKEKERERKKEIFFFRGLKAFQGLSALLIAIKRNGY